MWTWAIRSNLRTSPTRSSDPGLTTHIRISHPPPAKPGDLSGTSKAAPLRKRLFPEGAVCQKASQSSLCQQRKESESFSAGACTWQKIHLRLQVWNLFAYGEQIMRAADCKNWRKSPKGFFRQVHPSGNNCFRRGVILFFCDKPCSMAPDRNPFRSAGGTGEQGHAPGILRVFICHLFHVLRLQNRHIGYFVNPDHTIHVGKVDLFPLGQAAQPSKVRRIIVGTDGEIIGKRAA